MLLLVFIKTSIIHILYCASYYDKNVLEQNYQFDFQKCDVYNAFKYLRQLFGSNKQSNRLYNPNVQPSREVREGRAGTNEACYSLDIAKLTNSQTKFDLSLSKVNYSSWWSECDPKPLGILLTGCNDIALSPVTIPSFSNKPTHHLVC